MRTVAIAVLYSQYCFLSSALCAVVIALWNAIISADLGCSLASCFVRTLMARSTRFWISAALTLRLLIFFWDFEIADWSGMRDLGGCLRCERIVSARAGKDRTKLCKKRTPPVLP